MKLSCNLIAVVVTYNRLPHLKVAIKALAQQPCTAIIIVDNCSTDGSREWLVAEAEKHSNLDLVLAPDNLGGAGGFELGFRHALEKHKPDWLVCFDDDAYPAPDAFDAFMSSHLDGIDAVAAAVHLPDGSICEMNRPAVNPFWRWRLFLKTVLGQGRQGFHLPDSAYASKTPIDIDTTSFVGFFVRANVVEKVGFPEGRLFIYGDDVLYTLTIRHTGGRICFMPWIRFTHDCITFSTHEKALKPLWKAYYTYRNGLRVYHLAAGWMFWLFLPFKITRWILNARHYDNPRAYLRLTTAALKDAAKRDYTRPHTTVLALAKDDK